jgi:hypothetical protein
MRRAPLLTQSTESLDWTWAKPAKWVWVFILPNGPSSVFREGQVEGTPQNQRLRDLFMIEALVDLKDV